MKEYVFKAKIKSAGGGGTFVEFPYDVKKEFGKGKVPIRCTIDGEPYRGTMVKYGAPKHMILILKSIREKLNKGIGDEVDIWLVEDKEERVVDVPDDFRALLKKNKMGKQFDQLSFTHKREYLQWITTAKKLETRIARMEKALTKLKDKK